MLSSIIITCSVSAGLTKYKDNKTAGNETLLLWNCQACLVTQPTTTLHLQYSFKFLEKIVFSTFFYFFFLLKKKLFYKKFFMTQIIACLKIKQMCKVYSQ